MRETMHRFARSFVGRNLIMTAVCALAYLLQVSVMPYISIGGVTPSLLWIMLAIMVVGFGKNRSFWCGAMYGIVLQSVMPTTSIVSLMMYPLITIVAGLLFADKSHQQLEQRRAQGRSDRNASPLLRTPVCCAVMTFLYNVVNISYIYLRGTDVTGDHLMRGLLHMVLTTLLCLLLMFPIRYLLGLRYNRLERKQAVKYENAVPKPKGGRI